MDPIADMLVAIKNAGNARKQSVFIPYSNFKHAIAKILFDLGYIKRYLKRDRKKGKGIEIELSYRDARTPRIQGVKRVSRPSRRVYLNAKGLYSVKQGHGALVISTPKGVMPGHVAKKGLVGGEVLFEIW
jgi:small subunit ribosomal protein S8